MKKEIRTVNKEKGILQVTTVNERWYVKQGTDETTGLPTYEYVPSVTWICDHYPKGVGFYKFLANNGWDESVAIKEAAGNKGSKVHHAIHCLINGGTVEMNSLFPDSGGNESEITLEEYEAVMSFVEWAKDKKPTFKLSEFVVWGDGYAGTVDAECEIDGDSYLIDFKTSQQVWPSHILQVSAYAHALGDTHKLMILQLGYKRNKKAYKENVVENRYDLFLAAKAIWQNETAGEKPLQRDYPLALSLKKEV